MANSEQQWLTPIPRRASVVPGREVSTIRVLGIAIQGDGTSDEARLRTMRVRRRDSAIRPPREGGDAAGNRSENQESKVRKSRLSRELESPAVLPSLSGGPHGAYRTWLAPQMRSRPFCAVF